MEFSIDLFPLILKESSVVLAYRVTLIFSALCVTLSFLPEALRIISLQPSSSVLPSRCLFSFIVYVSCEPFQSKNSWPSVWGNVLKITFLMSSYTQFSLFLLFLNFYYVLIFSGYFSSFLSPLSYFFSYTFLFYFILQCFQNDFLTDSSSQLMGTVFSQTCQVFMMSIGKFLFYLQCLC